MSEYGWKADVGYDNALANPPPEPTRSHMQYGIIIRALSAGRKKSAHQTNNTKNKQDFGLGFPLAIEMFVVLG